MQKIEHAHSLDLHGNVRRLEARGRRELGVKFGTRILDACDERAASTNACRRRDLRNHGVAGSVLDHKMVVGIALQLELGQGGVDDPLRGLGRRDAVVRRNWIGRGECPHVRDGCIGRGIQVHQPCVGIGARLHRPAFNPALRQNIDRS